MLQGVCTLAVNRDSDSLGSTTYQVGSLALDKSVRVVALAQSAFFIKGEVTCQWHESATGLLSATPGLRGGCTAEGAPVSRSNEACVLAYGNLILNVWDFLRRQVVSQRVRVINVVIRKGGSCDIYGYCWVDKVSIDFLCHVFSPF